MPSDDERYDEQAIEEAEMELEAEEPQRPEPKPSVFDVVKQKAGEVVGGVKAEMSRRGAEEKQIAEVRMAAAKEARMKIQAEKASQRAAKFEARKTAAASDATNREYERAKPVSERRGPAVEAAKMGTGRFAEFTRRLSMDSQGNTKMRFDGEGGQLRNIVSFTGGEGRRNQDSSGSQLKNLMMQRGGGSMFGGTNLGGSQLKGMMMGGSGRRTRPGGFGGGVLGSSGFGGSRIGAIAKGGFNMGARRARRRGK